MFLPMDFRSPTSLPWLLAQLFMVLGDCCCHFVWLKNMPGIAGLFWRRWGFGWPAPCRYTCISIQLGRTHTRHLPWLYSFGIGTVREERGLLDNTLYWV